MVLNIIIILIISAVSSVLGYISSCLSIKLSNNLSINVKRDIFKSILNMPLNVSDKSQKGELFVKIDNDASEFSNLCINIIPSVINDLITAIIIGIVIFNINVKLSLVTFAAFPCNWCLYYCFGKKMKISNQKLKKNQDDYVTKVQEYFSRLKIIKILNAQDYVLNKYDKYLNNYHAMFKKR